MANQQNSYTGSQGTGTNSADFSFTFPSFTTGEVKVEVDNVVKTLTTHYTVENYNTTSGGTVRFTAGNIPTGTTPVRIFRQTDVDSPKATFTAGSSLKAGEINDNFKQVRHALQEAIGAAATDRKVQEFNIEDGAITSAKIKDLTIVEGDIANSAVTSNKIADNAVTTTEILNGAVTNPKLAANSVDSGNIINNSVDANKLNQTSGAEAVVTAAIRDDAVTNAKVANDAIHTEQIMDGQVDAIKLNQSSGSEAVVTNAIRNDAVTTAKIAANAVTTTEIANDAVTAAKIADAVIVTNSEQASHSVNDTTFFTTAAAEARYFNASTGETIKNGDSFPDNDTTIATTAAINDRIVDLVEEVGGFIPIANETSFPDNNPDVNSQHGQDASRMSGTIISVKTASTNLVPSGTTVTIANGTHIGNSTVTITGVPSTIPSGFGFLVETTSTTHTYAFHRLTPKATEVTTVAGKATEVTTIHTNINNVNTVATNISDINAVAADATDIGAVAAKATEIGRLGTADAVADMAILGTADVVSDLNTLGTADVVSDMNMLATSDVIADMNMLAVSDVISDMNDLATSGNITAMSTCSTNIASINNASNNISSANNFGDQYQVASNNPSTDGGGNALAAGDLYFNTSANELKVYNGSSWQGGVTASGSFAATTGNTFTGDNRYNDGVKALFGTGSDLQLVHTGTYSNIYNATGDLDISSDVTRLKNSNRSETFAAFINNGQAELYYDNSRKLHTTSGGVYVTGNIELPDDGELKLGNSGDLAIYHNDGLGSSWIYNSTGELHIRSDSIFLRSQSDGASYINCTDNGSVDLYYNGSKKLQTVNSGVEILGVESTNAELFISADEGDDNSDKWKFVAFAAPTGEFVLSNYTSGAWESSIKAVGNGAVELYYDASKKFETTSTGVDITGNLHVDALPDTTTNSLLKIAIQDTDGTLKSDDSIKINPAQNVLNVDGTIIAASHMRASGNGPLQLTTSNGNGVVDINVRSSHIEINGNLLPATDSTDNLGSNTVRWANAYVDTYYGDGSNLTGINTDLVADTSPQLGGDLDTNGHEIFLDDSHAIKFGAGNDLVIESDGTNGLIKNHVGGAIYVRANTNVQLMTNASSGGADNAVTCVNNGGVKLHYDNSEKFETTSTGGQLSGQLTVLGANNTTFDHVGVLNLTGTDAYNSGNAGSGINFGGKYNSSGNTTTFAQISGIKEDTGNGTYDGALTFGVRNDAEGVNIERVRITSSGMLQLRNDSGKLELGANQDVQLYHDGTASRLHSASHPMYIRTGGQFGVFNGNGTESIITGDPDGAVSLFYDNSKKLETTSAGVSVTGACTLSSHLVMGASDEIKMGGSSQMTIWHTGSDFNMYNNTGNIIIANASGTGTGEGAIVFKTGNNNTRAYLANDGHFYPASNNSFDLGTSSNRWRNVYTNDLHLSNEGHSNEVDGTWGNWTIQEGESDLFLKNNRSGKKYKFNLTEVS